MSQERGAVDPRGHLGLVALEGAVECGPRLGVAALGHLDQAAHAQRFGVTRTTRDGAIDVLSRKNELASLVAYACAMNEGSEMIGLERQHVPILLECLFLATQGGEHL